MRTIAGLAAIVALLTVTGCAQKKTPSASEQANQRWNQVRSRIKLQLAKEQLDARAFNEAAESSAEAMHLDPSDPSTYLVLAQVQIQSDNLSAAQNTLALARKSGVISPDLLYTEGVILERHEKYQQACDLFNRARLADPTCLDYLVAEAECLVALGRPSLALQLVTEQMPQFQHEATLHALAGHISALLNDKDQAIQHYSQALLIVPDHEVVAESCGVLMADLGQYAHAIGVLEPLIRNSKDGTTSGAATRAFAISHIELGDPYAAMQALKPYTLACPRDLEAQILLAKAAVSGDDLPTALRAINIARSLDRDNTEVDFVEAVINWKRGEHEKAIEGLQHVLSRTPNDVEAHCLLADTLVNEQQLHRARGHYQRALDIDPECTWAAEGLEAIGGTAISNADQTALMTTSVDVQPMAMSHYNAFSSSVAAKAQKPSGETDH